MGHALRLIGDLAWFWRLPHRLDLQEASSRHLKVKVSGIEGKYLDGRFSASEEPS